MTLMSVHVWGDLACFTRPENKVERVSYPIMTPTAAEGVLSSIFWKREFTWEVDRIEVVRTGGWVQHKRNEVGSRQAWRPSDKGLEQRGYDVETDRQQRHTLMLRDVAYNIYARISLLPHATDPIAKWQDQFRRRVRKGKCFSQPYLGTRECSCYFRPVTDDDAPVEWDADLGLMLGGFRRETKSVTPVFFEARIERGILRAPPPPPSPGSVAHALATELPGGDHAA